MAKLIEIALEAFSENELKQYQELNRTTYQDINTAAKRIKRKAIIHISATPYGGGVAELLRKQIPMEKSLGLESKWLVINAKEEFFRVTKKIHNLLQGKAGFLSEGEKKLYFSVNNQLKKQLLEFLKKFKIGIVVVHDPQPLPLLDIIPKNFSSLLRLHIDLSSPNPSIIEFFRPLIVNYNFVILSNRDYLPALPWLKKPKTKIIYPAIDPFSEKNKPMSKTVAKIAISEYGINPGKPIISQISRFDSWKDPLGVIQAYYLAKNEIPDLQLVLVGFFEAQDDPEAILIFEEVKKYAKGDNDIHLFYNLNQLKTSSDDDVFINALQTASQIIIQASIREGFGLTITEAMWKGKQIIARTNSGALLQIENNKNGILVNSPEEIGKAVVYLLQNKKLGERLGKAAKFSVKRNFLMPRFILDNLKLCSSLN